MTASRAAALCIASAAALGGCAAPEPPLHSAKAFARALPLCALLKNPKPYVGKRILVRGYLMSTPHGREFFDTGCENGSLKLNVGWPGKPPETARGRRLRLLYDDFADQFARRPPFVPVVYSGIFSDDRVPHILYGPYSLEAAEIVALRRQDVRDRVSAAGGDAP